MHEGTTPHPRTTARRTAHRALIAGLAALWLMAAAVQPARTQPAAPDTSYRVYTGKGTPATLGDVVAAMARADVVFIGETHDDPTAHALQYELLRTAHRQYGTADTTERAVAVSLEMLARDVQPILDEYLAGLITERHFVASSRLWSNYAEAYRPLVEYAKANHVAVLAANAPRRYVNRVARLGPEALDALPSPARQWLPPLPPPDPSEAYRAKWMARMHAGMPPADSTADSPHGAERDTTAAGSDQAPGAHHGAAMGHLLQAQALWDATMAHTLARHLMNTPGALVLHVTGSFHVSEGTGTPEQLAHYRPSARPLIVTIRPSDDVARFDPDAHAGLGDFVVLTDDGRVPEQPPASGTTPGTGP